MKITVETTLSVSINGVSSSVSIDRDTQRIPILLISSGIVLKPGVRQTSDGTETGKRSPSLHKWN